MKLLQLKLYPADLRSAVAQHIEYQKGRKKKLKGYVRLLVKEAVVRDKIRTTGTNHADK